MLGMHSDAFRSVWTFWETLDFLFFDRQSHIDQLDRFDMIFVLLGLRWTFAGVKRNVSELEICVVKVLALYNTWIPKTRRKSDSKKVWSCLSILIQSIR